MAIGTTVPPSSLAALRDTAEHLAKDIALLAERVRAACDDAKELRLVSQLYRRERSAWAAIMGYLPDDPDRMVVLCAYCHRVRGDYGWTPLPPGIQRELKKWAEVNLSHGFCPDCLRTHNLG